MAFFHSGEIRTRDRCLLYSDTEVMWCAVLMHSEITFFFRLIITPGFFILSSIVFSESFLLRIEFVLTQAIGWYSLYFFFSSLPDFSAGSFPLLCCVACLHPSYQEIQLVLCQQSLCKFIITPVSWSNLNFISDHFMFV